MTTKHGESNDKRERRTGKYGSEAAPEEIRTPGKAPPKVQYG
jgi:hypothetical protein